MFAEPLMILALIGLAALAVVAVLAVVVVLAVVLVVAVIVCCPQSQVLLEAVDLG